MQCNICNVPYSLLSLGTWQRDFIFTTFSLVCEKHKTNIYFILATEKHLLLEL